VNLHAEKDSLTKAEAMEEAAGIISEKIKTTAHMKGACHGLQ
jgi:hypothetical protein